MASSYALPQPPLPHNHGHGHGHGHGHSHGHGHHGSLDHSHSHSHSPPSFGHSRSSRSNPSNPSSPSNSGAMRSYNNSQSQTQSHSHIDEDAQARAQQNISHHRANSLAPLLKRENRPSPLRQSTGELLLGSGGKMVGEVPQATEYEAPLSAVPHAHPHDHDHDHHAHGHGPRHSKFTAMLLPYTSKWPLIHAIMTDKDSRRIFYFMGVNFTFMGVQAVYGYLTDSLGLLSDSIHMFFDCVALAVGLFASVMGKWPPSERFPYGFGKIETLSGFANGIFLVLISVEIMFEGFERLLEGRETKRLRELFIVSTLGLIVNLLGIFAFGSHGHHGHDHGHGHSHDHVHSLSHSPSPSHGHGHSHSHGNDHDHDHGHDHDCDSHQKHEHGHTQGHAHGHAHSHSHDNENMHGIYLHILADTLGSASVIFSTILTYLIPWSGWDPLASLLIAYLILITATPLVKSSARRLLLTIPADAEYNLRNTLSEITNQRGVASYSVPKFWANDGASNESGGKLLGVIHVAAMRGADMEEVRDRVKQYLGKHGIELTIQMERESDTTCWCGMGRVNSALSPLSPKPF
ncbi:Uu.00g024140.m01.CDS01 [Anthostomella pinea]|uniref:Zinc transporter n=1 Tax=Anthostomella pinea TaxID=933095 RepID=A0AAI8W142_9PEZI|nr:Uu.00g024140.m01.CDS01 [Anthostomella pinea]